jgi:RNA polymerase sigma-54 factor
MGVELRQSLTLAQQLIMTPQLQQAIKLLQLSRLELVETLSQEMEENPVLEDISTLEYKDNVKDINSKDEAGQVIGEDVSVTPEEKVPEDVDWEAYTQEYSSGRVGSIYEKKEFPSFENITSTKTNLTSHLTWQLGMSDLDDEQRIIGTHIIGNLNDDGYLDISLEELTDNAGSSPEKALETLRVIQTFDPVGVAARDTRESLLIQVRMQGLEGTIVEKIIADYLREIEDRKFNAIAQGLSVTLNDIISAMTIIQSLEPKPGRTYSDEEPIYIVPDVYVFKVGDDYEIQLNQNGMPRLNINAYYKSILQNKDSLADNTKSYLNEKLKSAAWLIKSIHQRQRTIYKATESIVRFQRDFFDHGIAYLKPLVLRDVAEDIEMHESTVSRVTTHKYVHSPQGLFELKFFFNSSVKGVEGNVFSSESVRDYIRNMINSEDKNKPFSDKEIVALLRKNNIEVARRTVAKYREAMGFLASRQRKNPY